MQKSCLRLIAFEFINLKNFARNDSQGHRLKWLNIVYIYMRVCLCFKRESRINISIIIISIIISF